MVLYHRTGERAADSIVELGFRDGTGTYMTDRKFSGVWVSNEPIPDFAVTIEVEIGERIDDLSEYEWKDDANGSYREWLVPAAVLNQFPRIVVPR